MTFFVKVGYAFDIIYIKLDAHVCQKAALKRTRDHTAGADLGMESLLHPPRGSFFDYSTFRKCCPMFSPVCVIH